MLRIFSPLKIPRTWVLKASTLPLDHSKHQNSPYRTVAKDSWELAEDLFGSTEYTMGTSGVPRNFFRGGGSTNSVEDRGQRERGSGGGSLVVRGSGVNCNLVQEISFHIVKFS